MTRLKTSEPFSELADIFIGLMLNKCMNSVRVKSRRVLAADVLFSATKDCPLLVVSSKVFPPHQNTICVMRHQAEKNKTPEITDPQIRQKSSQIIYTYTAHQHCRSREKNRNCFHNRTNIKQREVPLGGGAGV